MTLELGAQNRIRVLPQDKGGLELAVLPVKREKLTTIDNPAPLISGR